MQAHTDAPGAVTSASWDQAVTEAKAELEAKVQAANVKGTQRPVKVLFQAGQQLGSFARSTTT
jgi:hypothetical protein